MVAGIAGGGIVSGQAVRYSLVAGTGDDDNADFAVSGRSLVIARRLNHEERPVRHLRLKWEWIDSITGSAVLASGERAMTIVLQDSTADDDDADGMTEAQETLAGTVPADSSSVLKIDSLTVSPGWPAVLAFAAVAGRAYLLESSTDLTDRQPEPDAAAYPAITTGPTTVQDPAPEAGRKFYRLAVSLTP